LKKLVLDSIVVVLESFGRFNQTEVLQLGPIFRRFFERNLLNLLVPRLKWSPKGSATELVYLLTDNALTDKFGVSLQQGAPMFARVKKSGNYQYLQIVENRKEKGKVKQRVIATVGRMDQLQSKGRVETLIRSLSRFSEQTLLILSGQSDLRPMPKRSGLR
jgi:hypothetical protein